jgi:hypothetical protein
MSLADVFFWAEYTHVTAQILLHSLSRFLKYFNIYFIQGPFHSFLNSELLNNLVESCGSKKGHSICLLKCRGPRYGWRMLQPKNTGD